MNVLARLIALLLLPALLVSNGAVCALAMPASRAGAFPFLQEATGHRLQVETATEPARTVPTTYDYDAANNRKHKTVGGVTATYNYNTLNQLTGWTDTAGKSASYTYDFSGNRTTRTVGTLTDSYGYDVDNRLVRLTKNTAGGTTGSYAYVYDHRTRRVSRTEGSVTTKVVFSGGTSVQEYTGAGAGVLTVDYVRGSDWGGGVGGILYSMRGAAHDTPSFAHYNRREDVTARTDGAGAITYQASYEAGGTRTAEFGATQDRQKANTKEEDPTGLLNEGQRYRDLETDTFITRDPAGFVDGPNLYAYVRQNPWSAFDPDGLASGDKYKSRDDAAVQAAIDISLGRTAEWQFDPRLNTNNSTQTAAANGPTRYEFTSSVVRTKENAAKGFDIYEYTAAKTDGSPVGVSVVDQEKLNQHSKLLGGNFKLESIVHNHPVEQNEPGFDSFSPDEGKGVGDKGVSNKLGVPNYLVGMVQGQSARQIFIKKYTPDGSKGKIEEYNFKEKKFVTSSDKEKLPPREQANFSMDTKQLTPTFIKPISTIVTDPQYTGSNTQTDYQRQHIPR